MTKPRYNLAIRTARRLLEKHRITEPSVNVEQIAKAAGAVIRRAPLDGSYSGTAIRRANGEAIIGVNENDRWERQRFSIAHELGHLLLHDAELHLDNGGVIGFRSELSSMATDAREIEANQFAAELLMPEDFIRRDLEKLRDEPIDDFIAYMAEKYEVSLQAMTFRISRFRKFEL